MRNLIILPVLLLWLLSLPACWDDARPIAWDRARTVLGPIPLKTQVAYVDSALDRVTFVDLGGDAPVIATTQVGRNAIYAVPSADRHRMFVITRGEEAVHAGEIDQPPLFWNLDPANPGAPPAAYAIGSPFDRVAVSADGNLAIAYFSAAGPDDTGFFRNPNELAVIDLSQPPGDTNPVLKTIRSFGSVPVGISLSPPMVVPGAADAAPRTFAFVLSDNNLTVLDASHPDRDDISIRLDLGGLPVTPKQVVFALDTATAYVRSDNASDVLQILLEPDQTTAGGNDFRPLLAQLGAGGGPTDIAVYDDPNGTRYLLAATPNTGAVVVIEADTGNFRAVPVADPIDRILLFPSGDGVTPHQALLASIGAELDTLHVLDLTHIEDPLVQPSVQDITLDQPVRDVVPVPDRDLAMIVHDSDRTVLGLLDMSTASTSPLLGVGKLDSYDFTPDGSHLIGATAGIARLGFVALDNLHPTDFRLDDPPVTVLATENGKIFVDHGDPLGHATIIPSATATRDDATVLTGFLTADLLDKEP
jgi:hypothetical protein